MRLYVHIARILITDLNINRPNGKTFEIRDIDEGIDLEEGDVVTIEYDSQSRRETPVNPRITRIRSDTNWETVLAEYARDAPQQNLLNGMNSVQHQPT